VDSHTPDRPEISIGMPVYNGANYLRQALESALAQKDVDLEVVLVDNGSTDATAAIAQQFASDDPRVRVESSPENRGAAYSFNRCVELARGRYFRWAAHDDVFEETFTRRCIDALEHDRGASVAVTQAEMIDEDGDVVRTIEDYLGAQGSDPVRRALDIMFESSWCLHIFGVVRLEELRTTGLIGAFAGSDHITLLELALRGRFVVVSGYGFGNREHRERSLRAHGQNRERDRDAWFDPSRRGDLTLPRWRRFVEYAKGVLRAPIPRQSMVRLLLSFPRVMVDGDNRRRLALEPLGYLARRARLVVQRFNRL